MGKQEKVEQLAPPVAVVVEEQKPVRKSSWRSRVPFALLGLLVVAGLHKYDVFGGQAAPVEVEDVTTLADIKSCDQVEPLITKSFDVSAIVHGQKDRIVNWLADAVKVPTEIFDEMGEIGVDERWDVFYKFADYLEKSFPLIHKHTTRTRVMTHALIFEWEGKDKSLKPLLLTAHQDVVPVLDDTRGKWTHDPYAGYYDGKDIWGRGSMDDKSGLIGSMAAIELLLESGKFQPERTVILAFGTDEEAGGKIGAYNLGKWLEEKYGKNSIAMLIDEGGGMLDILGQTFAIPAVAEKGYLDVELKVLTKGGHSSMPPPHTGIGLASLAIAELESHPYPPLLNIESPVISFAECAARYAPATPASLVKEITKLARSIAKGKVDKEALAHIQGFLARDPRTHALIATTQAADIINGGVKINALPEVVTAYINHRISIASTPDEVQERMAAILLPMAKQYKLSLEAFGKNLIDASEGKAGKLVLSTAWNSTLYPAPISPFTNKSPAWRVLAGTIRGVHSTRPGAEDSKEEVYMAPLMSTGNTDTKRYWNLTRNIYRYAHLKFGGVLNNAHTVDEWIGADDFVEQVRWFAHFIVNVDESREEF